MNSTERLEDGPQSKPGPGDYFVLGTRDTNWYISGAMARAVDAELVAAKHSDWIVFVDVSGSRIRLRARLIQYLAQCYTSNRSADRAFWRWLRRESKSERDWDE